MLLYWIWLSLRKGISDKDRWALLEHFRAPEDLYHADPEALAQLPELSGKAAETLLDKSLEEATAILTACTRQQIGILPCLDPRYPETLRSIPDAPLLLYYRGQLPQLDRLPLIGVVGTRKASSYGLETARLMGSQLAAHGAVVVSGMAEGVDAAATQGALEAGGFALGILGCGVDRVYPRCNRELFQKMESQGCLLSEYPPGTAPTTWHFPRRNRIISGLSRGVLVVEAPEKSGALITARQAMDQGRDVFVVPGNLGISTCQGSNGLLRSGATAIMRAWDILSEYQQDYPGILRQDAPPPPPPLPEKKTIDIAPSPAYIDQETNAADLDPLERTILSALGSEERLIDTVIAEIGLSSGEALAALTLLEVRGYVTTRPGGWAKASKNH